MCLRVWVDNGTCGGRGAAIAAAVVDFALLERPNLVSRQCYCALASRDSRRRALVERASLLALINDLAAKFHCLSLADA